VRRLSIIAAAVFAAGLSAQAQEFPSKTVTLVVPFTPGGSPDVVARLISEELRTTWGQPVIVENRAGAAGNTGASRVVQADDAHTLLVAVNTVLTVNPHMARSPFDPIKDLAPIAKLASVPSLLVISKDVPATSVAELIALAKSKPGSLAYASAGNGSPQHLAGALFASMASIDMVHVPYRGASPVIADLITNRVQVFIGAANTMLPLIENGDLRALATTSMQRLPAMPNLPTVSEAGLPGYETDIWLGLLAPSSTPPGVVERIAADVTRALGKPDVKAKLAKQGIEVTPSSPRDLAELIHRDHARWGDVVRKSGISTPN
jgi:tripartite-type tricarboxylate transporter receptor subunit TctC